MANRILNEAERHFGKIDRSILFPMADHIAFAVQRLQKGEKISNPLTEDIKTLFHSEFKVASMIQTILKEEKQIDIDEDEIGYVALHIHSALEKRIRICLDADGAGCAGLRFRDRRAAGHPHQCHVIEL